MRFYQASNCTIIQNEIDGSAQRGVYMSTSSNSNNFTQNTFKNSPTWGIHIRDGSNWNRFWENIIDNNALGFYIEDPGTDSSFNLIYNNTFKNNNLHAKDDCVNNYWNNSIIGNTWDNTTDADDNGVPDILNPYPISGAANAMDYLPWIDDGDDKC